MSKEGSRALIWNRLCPWVVRALGLLLLDTDHEFLNLLVEKVHEKINY